MPGRRAGLRSRREPAHAAFLAAANDLAGAVAAFRPELSRSRRIVLTGAVLRLGEADRTLARALALPERTRLERAAAELELARTSLVDAGREAACDAARRRALSLVTSRGRPTATTRV